MISILLIDDHQIYRDGIKSFLETKGDIEVIGESWDVSSGLKLIVKEKPDVLVLDLSLGDESGINLLLELQKKKISQKTVVLTMHDGSSYLNRCLELGTLGYILKNESAQELCNAIYEVAKGKAYLSKEATRLLHSYFSRKRVSDVNLNDVKVTLREKEVLQLIDKGFNGSQISETLFISTRTVETHKRNLFKKLNVANSIELLNKARALSLFD